LTGTSDYSFYSFGSYSTPKNDTYIVGSDVALTTGAVANMLVLMVPGEPLTPLGTWTTGDDGCTLRLIVSSVPYTTTGGYVTITDYEAIGGRIKGTFSGSFVSTIDGAQVEIINGVIDVKRDADDLYND
jgi:hypothetical protein